MRNLHILFLTPFWCWLNILFCKEYFKRFPYEKRNDVKNWNIKVFLDSPFRQNIKYDEDFHGEYYKAYIKARIEALKIDFKYPDKFFGVSYTVGEVNVHINNDD